MMLYIASVTSSRGLVWSGNGLVINYREVGRYCNKEYPEGLPRGFVIHPGRGWPPKPG